MLNAGGEKRAVLAALAACVLLSGCSTLLERSYSVVEPYADRYWDSSAEDTLNVDNYQDLVNSLLMLIEQRAEEAVIRCSGEVSSYLALTRARNEVRSETTLGSYLLKSIQFTFEDGTNYASATFRMTYREDAEDLSGLMSLSDSQSLVDLLRLAVREEHEKLTARFTYDMPRDTVKAAVESYWQELCREEMDSAAETVSGEVGELLPEDPDDEPQNGPEDGLEGSPAGDPESSPEDGPEDDPENSSESSPANDPEREPEPSPETPENPEAAEEISAPEEGELVPPDPEPIVYPPCPWTVRFYPNRSTAEVVEILLEKP